MTSRTARISPFPGPQWELPARLRRLKAARTELLARAAGLDKSRGLKVLDACAGLGHDSLVLLFAGAEVTACERHPQVHELLYAEYQRLRDGAYWQRYLQHFELLHADACELMTNRRWDVIYLDPMYPDTRRKAAPSAELTALAGMVGSDDDADALLQPALRAADKRVVVKRPRRAPPLAGVEAHAVMQGNSLRFDIYRPTVSNKA